MYERLSYKDETGTIFKFGKKEMIPYVDYWNEFKRVDKPTPGGVRPISDLTGLKNAALALREELDKISDMDFDLRIETDVTGHYLDYDTAVTFIDSSDIFTVINMIVSADSAEIYEFTPG
jgi:hypothetical protein